MTTPYLSTAVRGKGRHYKNPKTGRMLPSVTNILSVLDKPALPRWAAKETAAAAAELKSSIGDMEDADIIDVLKAAPWRKSSRAADRGTTIHEWLENSMLGLPLPSLDGEAAAYEQAAHAWLDDMQPEPVRLEVTMFGKGYAGTADGIVRIDGQNWMIDYKTSKALYESAALQVAALAECQEAATVTFDDLEPAPKIDRLAAVRIGDDGRYEMLEVVDRKQLMVAFESCRKIWKWKYEGEKPFGAAYERHPDE
jgi:hypothetical protein